ERRGAGLHAPLHDRRERAHGAECRGEWADLGTRDRARGRVQCERPQGKHREPRATLTCRRARDSFAHVSAHRYPESPVFYRKLAHDYPKIVRGEGCWLIDERGKRYL